MDRNLAASIEWLGHFRINELICNSIRPVHACGGFLGGSHESFLMESLELNHLRLNFFKMLKYINLCLIICNTCMYNVFIVSMVSIMDSLGLCQLEVDPGVTGIKLWQIMANLTVTQTQNAPFLNLISWINLWPSLLMSRVVTVDSDLSQASLASLTKWGSNYSNQCRPICI